MPDHTKSLEDRLQEQINNPAAENKPTNYLAEVECHNNCNWRGMEAELVDDEAGGEPHCPKCKSNSAILGCADCDKTVERRKRKRAWAKTHTQSL